METDAPQPRVRGRPKDLGKRAAILDAARLLFLERGVDGVALDAVIAASGVSKATFYANFADRAALVEALIRTESDRIVPEHGAFADGGDLIEDLTAFGVRLMNLLTHADMMSFERLIITASRVHADAPRRFFDAGPGRSRQALAKRLALAVDHGELVIDDPVLAAEDLVGLWQGMMRVELAVGLRPTPTPAMMRARVDRGVRLFMRLYGASETGRK